MNDDVAATGLLDGDRFHHPAAPGGAVAGMLVDMLAVEAGGTVVGEPVTLDLGTAALTGEVFDIAGKEAGHGLSFALPRSERT